MLLNLQMVWFESPTNPLMNIIDIKACCQIAHSQPNVIAVVDNTFLTPYFQRPLELGVDIVMYSLTKYMNGHSDVVMGAALTNDDEIHNRLYFNQRGNFGSSDINSSHSGALSTKLIYNFYH